MSLLRIFIGVAALVLASSGPVTHKSDRAHADFNRRDASPVAAVGKKHEDQLKTSQPPCYIGSEAGLSCDAISAKAAAEQALDATKQTATLGLQIGVGLATLVAAIAAAGFAGSAARDTKRAADAANDANRPWLEITIDKFVDVTMSEDHILIGMDVKVRNRGSSPAARVMLHAEIGVDVIYVRSLQEAQSAIALRDTARNVTANNELGHVIFPNQKLFERVYAVYHLSKLKENFGFTPSPLYLDVSVGSYYQFAGNREGYSETGAALAYQKGVTPGFPVEHRAFQADEFLVGSTFTGRVV